MILYQGQQNPRTPELRVEKLKSQNIKLAEESRMPINMQLNRVPGMAKQN